MSHLKLWKILQDEEWQKEPFFASTLNKALKAKDKNSKRILLSLHAIDLDGNLPNCKECQKTNGPLLEAVKDSDKSKYPKYRVRHKSLTNYQPSESQHQILKNLLISNNKQATTITTADIVKLLKSKSFEKHKINSLVGNLNNHHKNGGCKECNEEPLFEILDSKELLVVLGKNVIKQETLPDKFLDEKVSLKQVVNFLVEQKLWETHQKAFINHFKLNTLSKDELLLFEYKERLINELWSLQNIDDWKAILKLYTEYVKKQEFELILQKALPFQIKRFGISCLNLSNFIKLHLDWFIGGEGREDFAELLDSLKHSLPSPQILTETFKWLEVSVIENSKESIKNIFIELPQRMDWKFEHPKTSPEIVTSSLLSILFPEKFMTLSKSMHGFQILSKIVNIPAPIIEIDTLNPENVALWTLWGQHVCLIKNNKWNKYWLEPRKLDQIMFAISRYLRRGYLKEKNQNSVFLEKNKEKLFKNVKVILKEMFLSSISTLEETQMLFEDAFNELSNEHLDVDLLVFKMMNGQIHFSYPSTSKIYIRIHRPNNRTNLGLITTNLSSHPGILTLKKELFESLKSINHIDTWNGKKIDWQKGPGPSRLAKSGYEVHAFFRSEIDAMKYLQSSYNCINNTNIEL